MFSSTSSTTVVVLLSAFLEVDFCLTFLRVKQTRKQQINLTPKRSKTTRTKMCIDDIFPYGKQQERKYYSSLNKQISTIPPTIKLTAEISDR